MGPATTGTITASPGSASPRAIAGALLLALVCAAPASGQDFDATPRSPEWLAAHCIPLREGSVDGHEVVRRCRVNGFARLGVVDGRAVHYALYRYVELSPEELADTSFLESREDHPFNRTAAVLFEGAPGGRLLTPFWADAVVEFGVSYFEAPELLSTSERLFLRVPHPIAGTGHANADRYFVREGPRWLLLDTESWLEDLSGRLPPGHAVVKGIVPDLVRMRAESSVRREGDANCCPTGGRVAIELSLEGRTLRIARLTYRPPESR